MLLDQIKQSIQTSLKEGDSVRLSTLRMLLSAIRYQAIATYGAKGEEAMTDEDVLSVIKKQAKERKESIEAYTKGDRAELALREQKELAILEEFLPKEISDEDLTRLLQPLISSSETNFGLLMKEAMVLVKGKADGGRVSALLKQLLKT